MNREEVKQEVARIIEEERVNERPSLEVASKILDFLDDIGYDAYVENAAKLVGQSIAEYKANNPNASWNLPK